MVVVMVGPSAPAHTLEDKDDGGGDDGDVDVDYNAGSGGNEHINFDGWRRSW